MSSGAHGQVDEVVDGMKYFSDFFHCVFIDVLNNEGCHLIMKLGREKREVKDTDSRSCIFLNF